MNLPLFQSEGFMLNGFKIVFCNKRGSHSWCVTAASCLFSHQSSVSIACLPSTPPPPTPNLHPRIHARSPSNANPGRACCPFAHPGEMGRRRSLSKVWYEAVMCGYVRRGETCPLGDGYRQVGVCVGGWGTCGLLIGGGLAIRGAD